MILDDIRRGNELILRRIGDKTVRLYINGQGDVLIKKYGNCNSWYLGILVEMGMGISISRWMDTNEFHRDGLIQEANYEIKTIFKDNEDVRKIRYDKFSGANYDS